MDLNKKLVPSQTATTMADPTKINSTARSVKRTLSSLLAFATRPTIFLLLQLILISQNHHQTEAIKLQPEGKEKFYWSSEQFVITCQNNNNIKNVKIRWIGPNGLDITEDRSQRVHAESTGPHGHRLVVMNATASIDDGQYKCTLGSTDDRNPREHIEFNLKIFKSTSFMETQKQIVLPAGKQGTLSCQVEFDPNVLSASVSWVRDKKPIEMFNDSSYSVTEYDATRQLSQLTISPVTKQHDGIYTCRAVAVTAQLSKIDDHDIRLETNYAPQFDRDSHTVWVERGQQLGGSQTAAGSGNRLAGGGTVYGGERRHQVPFRARPIKHRFPNGPITEQQFDQQQQQHNNSSSVIRVELRCTCQANPPAGIMWSSTQSPRFVFAKGEPAHIIEEPRTEIEGHNTTSTLTIAYNLDPDWSYRRDQYYCSASNKLGKATKTFSVEQGDPPPAFNVGPRRHYSSQTSLFTFTLLGPNFDPEAAAQQPPPGAIGRLVSQAELMNTNQQEQHEILPPVDSFRIRAESSSSDTKLTSTTSNSSPNIFQAPASPMTAANYLSMRRRDSELSVQWTLDGQQASEEPPILKTPQNFTVNLGRLPSGQQRLYLEAHNAVGWSPNATYLGDYYIVSGCSSSLSNGIQLFAISLCASLLMLVQVSLSGPAHNSLIAT